MARSKTDLFIDAYKEFEQSVIRYSTTYRSAYDYEQAHKDEDIGKKLFLCRIIRNYLQHHTEPFVTATSDMIEFLKEQKKAAEAMEAKVGERCQQLRPVTTDETFLSAAEKISDKLPRLPVVEREGDALIPVGILTAESIRRALVDKNVKCEIKEHLKYIDRSSTYISPDTIAAGLKGIYIVTKDGSRKSEYIGIYTS